MFENSSLTNASRYRAKSTAGQVHLHEQNISDESLVAPPAYVETLPGGLIVDEV